MEDSITEDGASRRKSGRSIRKPDLFIEEQHEGSLLNNGSAKRKRPSNAATRGEEEDEVDEDSTSEQESEGEADEEELREQRKAVRSRVPKSSSKRQKMTNGVGGNLAIRSANIQSQAMSKAVKVQKARARQSQATQVGLYAEVFGRGRSGEDVAADWLKSYKRDNLDAMYQLVNFVLQCTGCDLKVEHSDIEDVDNVPSKIGDLQEEYQQAKATDYPLVSKLKQFVGFRSVLVEFCSGVMKTMHATSILYDEPPLWENIQVWVDTMSSAPIRPFRHTATLISLTFSTALCEIARDLQSGASTTRGQIETEKKKKSVNKGRLSTMNEKLKTDESRLEVIDTILKDEFDVVYVHRYRDVDPKIRIECVAALGEWITTYRQMFLEGQYLRYLGWVMSDSVSQTRSEVIKQLKTLFKNPRNIPALRAFTDRFRPRMVEMATRDTEPGVRADTIELLDRLRDAELLQPDDIDTVGALVFDTEPRVRKAVAKFFVSNIEDWHKVNTDDFDKEQFEEALPMRSDDYLQPTQSWIIFKGLGQTMSSYDIEDETNTHQSERVRGVVSASEIDSRYMLATQSIFPHMKELRDWEALAGYLLYDHSQITASPEDADVAEALKGLYKLNDGEEVVLLEVLDYAVKLSLIQLAESQSETRKGRKTKVSKDNIQEKQEMAAHNLTVLIPKLLNKFGSTPQAAAAILRLEQLLNPDLVGEFQQNETAQEALLDDINKQFMSHSDQHVLTEASKALLNARNHEQAKESTEAKIQEIWDDALGTLQNLLRNQNVEARGTLTSNVLEELSNTAARTASLAPIADFTSTFESKFPASSITKKQKSSISNSSPLDVLLSLAKRGEFDPDTTPQFAIIEDALCTSVLTTISFYFLWKISTIHGALKPSASTKPALPSSTVTQLTHQLDTFASTLALVASSRPPLDHLRITALSTALDTFTRLSTLRHVKSPYEDLNTTISTLILPVPASLQSLILITHDKLEKSFARRTHRKLEETFAPEREPSVHDAPLDSDAEDGDDELDGDGEEDAAAQSREAKKQATLLAEKTLCEFTGLIVLAVVGQVVDGRVRERLERNLSRLGPNYREVVLYLDEDRGKARKKAAIKAKSKKDGEEKKKKSEPMVLDDDDIEDDAGEQGPGEDDDDEEALRERGLAEEIEDEAGEDETEAEQAEEEELLGD